MKKLIFGFGVVLLLCVFLFAGNEKKTTTDFNSLDSSLVVPVSDVDFQVSNASNDTLKTLVAGNKAKDRVIESQQDEINELQDGFVKLRSEINKSQSDSSTFTENKALMAKLEEMQRNINELKQKDVADSFSSINPDDQINVPIDAIDTVDDDSLSLVPKLSSLPIIQMANSNAANKKESEIVDGQTIGGTSRTNSGTIKIEQMDLRATVDKNGQFIKSYPKTVEEINDTGNPFTPDEPVQGEELKTIPVYTIPVNSTLFGSVGSTAIIGRVPMGGTFSNPFRFKVMVGEKNLATNGHYIPNLKSMTLSGYAQGDFTLECVSGTIDKATFTFNDGTIRVVEAEASEGFVNQGDGLGWISDEAGVPCIQGQYISNMASYVATTGGLSFLGALGESIAASQETVLTEGSSVTSVVTGDALKAAGGKGVNESTKKIIEWFEARQESAFDAVFLPVGKSLIVHIEQNIEIDYEVNGRKTFHSSINENEDYMQW